MNVGNSINRRGFLSSSGQLAGGVAALATGAQLALGAGKQKPKFELSDAFPRYEKFNPKVPVYCATPELDGCFHRFFNTSPISPSGRYLAVTRLLHEDRLSLPGESAEIVLVDLKTGKTSVIAETRGFDSQLGAQAQWGASDNELFFNELDMKNWDGFGVRMDPLTGKRRNLEGPVFEVSQDGRYAAGICLLRSGITQRGYGVVVPAEVLPWNEGAASDDGVYLTDTATGKCRLIASYKDIVDACGDKAAPLDPERGGGYHGHQISWNPQGTRLMLCLAFNYPQPRKFKKRPLDITLVTLKPDGTDIQAPLPARVWNRLGNHPCWCPDGEHISMNFSLDPKMRYNLVRMRYDGQGLAAMTTAMGTGHPTLHPDGRHIITDTYQKEFVDFKDGTIPIRWINIADGTEETLVRICSRPPYSGPNHALRLDPHPAWDRTYTKVAFNACPTGARRVYIADLAELVS